MRPIVLASASPRRKALLEALGIPLKIRVSGVSEIVAGDPEYVALENARLKRNEVAGGLESPALVIAADTVVAINGRMLGKPVDAAEARSMLRELSGRTHRVITGVAVVDTDTDRDAAGAETTEVTFRELTDDQIDRFVTAVNPLDRAGAYTVDGPGSLIVARYAGCYQNVLGLPIPRLEALLEEIGDSLFARMDAKKAKFL